MWEEGPCKAMAHGGVTLGVPASPGSVPGHQAWGDALLDLGAGVCGQGVWREVGLEAEVTLGTQKSHSLTPLPPARCHHPSGRRKLGTQQGLHLYIGGQCKGLGEQPRGPEALSPVRPMVHQELHSGGAWVA